MVGGVEFSPPARHLERPGMRKRMQWENQEGGGGEIIRRGMGGLIVCGGRVSYKLLEMESGSRPLLFGETWEERGMLREEPRRLEEEGWEDY